MIDGQRITWRLLDVVPNSYLINISSVRACQKPGLTVGTSLPCDARLLPSRDKIQSELCDRMLAVASHFTLTTGGLSTRRGH